MARSIVDGSEAHELLFGPAHIAEHITSRKDLTKRHFSLAVWAFFEFQGQNDINGLDPSLVAAFAAAGLATFERHSDALRPAVIWSGDMNKYGQPCDRDGNAEDAVTYFARVCGPALNGDFDWSSHFAPLLDSRV